MSGNGTQHWKVVSSSNPCPICRVDRGCEVSIGGGWVRCRRVDAGAVRELKSGAGWLHQVGDHHEPLPPVSAPTTGHPKAPPDQLHKVYSALLHLLPLSPAHHKHLTGPQRQLTPEQIQRRGYRSLPAEGRAKIAARLIEQLCGDEELAGVPGFFISHKGGGAGYWTLAGAEGLLVPVRDAHGRIVGLQVRNMSDRCKKGERYKWFSSNPDNPKYRWGGTGSGTVPHVAWPAELKGARVWVTEGPLKADIAADRLGELVVAVPGVSAREGLLEALRELRAGELVVAFDADKREKAHVLKAEAQLAGELKAAGFEVLVADWSTAEGKGLDDLLLGGGDPALTPYSGPAAVAEPGKRRKVEMIEGKLAMLPVGPYLSITEARNRNAALMREGLTRNKRLFLASDTGTGKTTATMNAILYHFELDLRAIGRPEDGEEDLRPRHIRRQALRRLTGKRRTLFLVDQKDQLEALKREHSFIERGQREGWVVERRGRDETTCRQYGEWGEKMKVYGRRGHSIEAAFCVSCPAKDLCDYQADKRKAKKALVVIGTKAAYAHALEDLRDFDAVVVDEALGPLVYCEVPISGKDITLWLERLPAEALARPLFEALLGLLEAFKAEHHGEYDVIPLLPALRAILGAEGLRERWLVAARQLKAEDGTLACEQPGELGPVPLKGVGELVAQMGAELDRPEDMDTRLWLNWQREQREDGSGWVRWPVATLVRVRDELVQVLRGTTFINLDATPAPEMIALFPDADIERVRVAPNVHITQVSDELLGKKTMTPAKREKVAGVIDRQTRELLKPLIFTRKEDQPDLQRLVSHNGAGWGYYGRDNRAVNNEGFVEADGMVLAGLLQTPPGAVRRRVQALRDSPVPVELGPAEALTPYLGYEDEQGRGRARRRQIDPDPAVQRAIDHQVAADTLQAIGRLRAGMREGGPVPVLILSAYPIEGLRVDELVTLRALENRQSNLEGVNDQRQAQTREKVELELAAALEAGETLSQRELARRAGVSRKSIPEKSVEDPLKQQVPNYGKWPPLRQKNIGGEKLFNPLLVGASAHSLQDDVYLELSLPSQKHQCIGCPIFDNADPAHIAGLRGSKGAVVVGRPSPRVGLRPAHNCRHCGARESWWDSRDGWICGKCLAEPDGRGGHGLAVLSVGKEELPAALEAG